jgi:NADH:ubiquinone oxidoreductase subunit 6 (subunit J)
MPRNAMPQSSVLLAATSAVAPRTIALIAAIMVLGAAALLLLLPRPRRYALPAGVFLGVIALVLSGVLAGPTSFTPEVFLFYAFSAIAVASGCLLLTQRNPARAALSFALVVLSTCGLFLLLAAPFLMAATIIIYAGAIIVIFLFVLMLARQEGPSDADYRSYEPLLACVGGFILLGTLLYVLTDTYTPTVLQDLETQLRALAVATDQIRVQAKQEGGGARELEAADQRLSAIHEWLAGVSAPAQDEQQVQPLPEGGNPSQETVEQERRASFIKQHLPEGGKPLQDAVDNAQAAIRREKNNAQGGRRVNWDDVTAALAEVERAGNQARDAAGTVSPPAGRPLSDYSGPRANIPPEELRRKAEGQPPALPAENVAYLGRSLFTDYLLAVELAGTLLLVATIGAIAIATRRAERLP